MFKDKRYENLVEACKSGDMGSVNKCLAPGFFRKKMDVLVLGDEPLRLAVAEGHEEIVLRLVKEGADVDFANGRSLQTAVRMGNARMVSILLAQGARVDNRESCSWQSYRGSYGGWVHRETALMLAATGGHMEIVKLLVKNGADVNKWANSETEFHQYSMGGKIKGPPQEPLETAFSIAQQHGNHEIARFFQSKGAKTERRYWK